jgi:hypothetical protein
MQEGQKSINSAAGRQDSMSSNCREKSKERQFGLTRGPKKRSLPRGQLIIASMEKRH